MADTDSGEQAIASGNWKKNDHYKLLGLDHLRRKATKDDIIKAYRKATVKYHPDKQGIAFSSAAIKEEMNVLFQGVKKGYELLMNDGHRLLYDSVDDCDDSIPKVATHSNAPSQVLLPPHYLTSSSSSRRAKTISSKFSVQLSSAMPSGSNLRKIPLYNILPLVKHSPDTNAHEYFMFSIFMLHFRFLSKHYVRS